MNYLLISGCLMLFLLVYFKLAERFGIIDKPNERSSHVESTLRGGGVIFWFAAFLYFSQHSETNYMFFFAISFVSFISFYDDIVSLPSKLRILVQTIAITIILYNLGYFVDTVWWIIPIVYVFAVGIVNAYNFMDGINGMTAINTLIFFLTFLFINNYSDNIQLLHLVDNDFLIYPIIATVIFLFFNFRRKAICFAGDVGSITIAFWVIYLLGVIMLKTNSTVWLLLLAVYGVETTCTILHRLYLKQNIFKPHRIHFFQLLCNEYSIDHRIISTFYALTQIVVSFVVIKFYGHISDVFLWLIIIPPLVLIYSLKFRLMRKCCHEFSAAVRLATKTD